MQPSPWRPPDEAASAGAEAVLLEWLAAVRGRVLPGPAGLRDWARTDRPAFRAAFAAFAGLPASDTGLLDAAAAWLLGAAIRPDDRVLWKGPADDPGLRALAVTGAARVTDPGAATRVLDRLPEWPG